MRCDLLITRDLSFAELAVCLLIRHYGLGEHQPEQGAIMAKRKKGSKVQTRAKLKRGKARKVVKSARGKAKRTVASAKPKRASVKKAARKEVAPVVETVAAEVIEQPAPGEIEETRQVS
jgi:phage protein D